MRTNVLVEHRGFPLQPMIYSAPSSLRPPAVRYTVNWQPFATVWIYLHPTACCVIFVLLPVLQTIFKCPTRDIFLVAELATLRWTTWCPSSCCVWKIDVFDEAPANRLDLDSLLPGWGGSVCMICWGGIGEKDDNEKKWEVLKNI